MADDLVEYLLDCDALLRASKRIETPSRAGITAYKAAADEITRLRAAVEAERERCARVALDLYDPRKNNGAREWDEWSYAAAQVAAAIRAQPKEGE